MSPFSWKVAFVVLNVQVIFSADQTHELMFCLEELTSCLNASALGSPKTSQVRSSSRSDDGRCLTRRSSFPVKTLDKSLILGWFSQIYCFSLNEGKWKLVCFPLYGELESISPMMHCSVCKTWWCNITPRHTSHASAFLISGWRHWADQSGAPETLSGPESGHGDY